MGLLSKAINYREILLNKALRYLESKKSLFPKIIVDDETKEKYKISSTIISEREIQKNDLIEKKFEIENSDIFPDSDIFIESGEKLQGKIDSEIKQFKEILKHEQSDFNLDEIIPPSVETEINKIDEQTEQFNITDEMPEESPFENLEDNNLSFAEDAEEEIEVIESIPEKVVEIPSEKVLPQPQSINYYDTINQISQDMATLILDDIAYKKFNFIISDNFNFSKSALLIYFPPKQKFIYWTGKNVDNESIYKFSFDLSYNNVYINMAKEKSFLLEKDSSFFNEIENILSKNDADNSDFQLWIPFIFSARIIGIFLGKEKRRGEKEEERTEKKKK